MKITIKHNETSVEFENVHCNDVKSVIQITNETMAKIKGPFVVHQQGEHLDIKPGSHVEVGDKKLTPEIDLNSPPAPISFERVKNLFDRIKNSKWKNEPVLNDTLRFLNDCRVLFYGDNRHKTIFKEKNDNDE